MKFQNAAYLALRRPLLTHTGRFSSRKPNKSQEKGYRGMGANGGDGLGDKCWE